MAQLKVKQISDFVTAVGNAINATVGTAGVTAISVAKSEAISAAVLADITVASNASGDATSKANAAQAAAISSAEAKDVTRAATASTATSNALVSAVSQAEAKDVARATTTSTNLSNAISTEVVDRNTAIGVVNSRVTTLLGGSTEALDTFGEIKGFIDGLAAADVTTIAAISTAVSNDVVHSTAISTGISVAIVNDGLAKGYASDAETNAIEYADGLAGNYATAAQGVLADSALQDASAFDAAGSADDAEANAITEAGRLDAIVLSSAKSYADTAESDAISTASADATTKANAAQSAAISAAESKDVARASAAATALSNAIATEVSNRNTAIGVLDTDLQSQIDALAGSGQTEEIARWTSINPTQFTTDAPFDLNGHVAVFINGLQVHEAVEDGDGWVSADGQNFTVQGLGYDLEAGDHIIVSGKLV